MKYIVAISLLFIAGLAEAEEDFWSSLGSKEGQQVTKGSVSTVEASSVQKPKSLKLPGPGGDTYCMPTIVSPQKMVNTMKSMFPDGKLAGPAEWKDFAKRSEKAHQQAAPSVQHCRVGDWISVSDKFTALELCDFDSTPASAATFGVCRYRGQTRNINNGK